MGGHAWLLPTNNLPINKNLHQQAVSDDASNNFGSFEALAGPGEINHYLEIRHIGGFGHAGHEIGKGIITTVLTLHSQRVFMLFFF